VIHVDSLQKSFNSGTIQVIDRVSFSLDRGETMAIIGPSGCGKTTLLYLLSGLMSATAGSVTVKSRAVEGVSRECAFILQDFGLFPWKTVWQNVCMGMKIRGISEKEQRRKAEELLGSLGLADRREHFPARLSGGEKQRVAIARSMAMDPEILLMDEPFSSLDTITRERLQDTILHLWQANRFTMIMVTHSIEEAVFLGKKILVMSSRPGRIRRIIENPLAGAPEHRSSTAFFKTCNEVREMVRAA